MLASQRWEEVGHEKYEKKGIGELRYGWMVIRLKKKECNVKRVQVHMHV